jgi:molybdopterin/thiamine biosynthesis adenylyltransferase
MQKAWWIRHKGRLGYELKKLKEAGYLYSLDREWFQNNGNGLIHLEKIQEPYPGLKLNVYFSDTHPFFRFEVTAPTLDLDLHQNPFTKGLCLLGRAAEQWFSDDTIANVLDKQLGNTIEAGETKDGDSVAEKEDDQAEPYSDMYSYPPRHMIMTDNSFDIPDHILHGTLLIGLKGTFKRLTGIVYKVHDEQGELVDHTNPRLEENGPNFGYNKTMRARWVRLPAPVKTNNPEEFFKEAIGHLPSKRRPLQNGKYNGKIVEILAVYFPEEISRRHKGWGWTFCVRTSELKKGRLITLSYNMIRPGYIGQSDIMKRSSSLSNLKGKKIALFGLGCLGATSAIDFARCGIGRIDVLEYDYVDPCTIPRWTLGFDVVGELKTSAIENYIKTNYPFTEIHVFPIRLGGINIDTPTRNGDHEVLELMMGDADLVFDATADFNVQHLLSTEAKKRDIPYVCISATPGIWGGQITRIHPNKTAGCWDCINGHQTDFEAGIATNQPIPLPLSDLSPNGRIQPKGCGSPTFTGTGFDANVISTGGVRLAVSTLSEGFDGGYPEFDWYVAIVNLREKDGSAIPPTWETFKCSPHPKCHCQK